MKKALIAIVIALGVAIIGGSIVGRQMLFPIKYKSEITKYSKEYNIKPELLAAVINFETNFENKKYELGKSSGIAKFKEEYAEKYAKEMKMDDFKPEQLENPEVSIKMAAWYISQNYKDGDIKELMAKWSIKNGKSVEESFDSEEYAKQYYAPKIETNSKIYKTLYPEL